MADHIIVPYHTVESMLHVHHMGLSQLYLLRDIAISYQMKYLKGDLYVNGLVSQFSEAVADVVGILIFNRFGLSKPAD